MSYRQITSEERYRLSAFRVQGLSNPEIARCMGRHRSTVWREVRRNAHVDGHYHVVKAIRHASARSYRSRSHPRFKPEQLHPVWKLLSRLWSPEQIVGHLRCRGALRISHETIYRYIWSDRKRGGHLHHYLRCAIKQRRKRYGAYDSRGRLAGKRRIQQRPKHIELRRQPGHWEIDTVLGKGSRHCIVSLVERKSGYLQIGKLKARNVEQTSARTIELIGRYPDRYRTITADNGTEFHGYADIEKATSVPFYFATPHHAWERGTNENTNGLIRQYLPKNTSMTRLTQQECDAIATELNNRPRKRHGYKTPQQIFFGR
ncbi:MAG: IS30 family transposase [Pseudomonadota bacterium]